MMNQANNALIDIRNPVNEKEIPENKNPDKKSILWKKCLTLTNNKKLKDAKH